MYRLKKYVCSFIFLLILGGCGLNDNIRGDYVDMGKNMLINEQEISDKIIESLVKGINNKDDDIIKGLFSENSIKKSDKIDDSILDLYDYIDGDIISYSEGNGSGSTSESMDAEHRILIGYPCYYVRTDTEEYYFCLENCIIDTEDRNREGVKYLIVVKADDMTKIFDGNEKILFDGTEEIDRNGIFIPDMYFMNE